MRSFVRSSATISIYEHKERAPQRAAKWFVEIERQMRTLSQLPTRCPMIPEADEIGVEYRHLIWGNYRIRSNVGDA